MSGRRFEFRRNAGFCIGFGVSPFPFAITIWLSVAFWQASIGIGRGYGPLRDWFGK